MRSLRFFVLLLSIGLLWPFWLFTIHTAYADPQGINIFEIVPNPKLPGGSVTGTINVNIASADGSTTFCLYKASGLSGALPANIDLSYPSGGFGSITVTFTGASGAGICTGASGDSRVYSFTGGTLPAGDTTYSGEFTFPINSAQASGVYQWTLWWDNSDANSAPGSPNPRSASLTILGPTAITLQSTTISNTGSSWWAFLVALLLGGLTIYVWYRWTNPVLRP
jgi:hypothetical protein